MTPNDPEEAAGVHEGQILAGKYRVERVLGVGGMGVVVAAHHVQLDEKVAIKFLLPSMLRNQEVVSRFAREARSAVKIKSEHVARVSDVGTLENGAPYMIMEFLEGGDLAAWIQRQGPLPLQQAVDFILQACVGVASAHGIGIVHRDLKPANLFCLRGNDGQFIIKVLDFGISKVSNASDSGGAMTHTAAVMGSPYYMSPEQMQSAKEVDARTDIWALGVVLYELLTGSTPFAGESYAEIAIKVATASFAPVRVFRPDASPLLEAVIARCLEKDKRRRFSNVAELALALADFGSKRSRPSVEKVVGIIQAAGLSTSALALPASPIGARTPIPDGAPSSYRSPGTMAPSANTALGVPRRSKTLMIASIAGILSAALLGVLVWAKHPTTVAAPATTGVSAPGPTLIASAAAPLNPSGPEPSKPVDPAPAATSAASATRRDPAVPVTELQPASVSPVTKATQTESKKTPAGNAKSMTATASTGGIPPVVTAAPPPNRAKCNPPYFIDSAGHRQYKAECL
jgi:eukaryotic-like serine/threonine-protein kinase